MSVGVVFLAVAVAVLIVGVGVGILLSRRIDRWTDRAASKEDRDAAD